MTVAPRLVLVTGPLDNRERVAHVAETISRKTRHQVVEDSELAANCTKRSEWHLRWCSALKGELPNREPAQYAKVTVVIVPRPDGTIGAGTRSDVHAATTQGVEVKVVKSDGTLVALEKAGLELPSRKAAQKGKGPQAEFRKVAGRFFVGKPVGSVA